MKHLDENTIQAFLDGELPDDALLGATAHLANCETCTELLLVAEAEIAELNLAFAAENSQPCPTQRIWARIENEIEVRARQAKKLEVEQKSVWARFNEFFAPPQIAFAASFAAVVLVSLVSLGFFEKQLNQISESDFALESPEIKGQNLTAIAIPEISRQTINTAINAETIENSITETAPRAIRASFAAPRIEIKNQKSKIKNPKSVDAPLAEEKDYLNTIAELSKSVAASGGDGEMRPSFRVEYERNAAMLDQAIAQMQKQARRNPRNENAKRILFASYQNKIDFLSAVSEKSQLVASVR